MNKNKQKQLQRSFWCVQHFNFTENLSSAELGELIKFMHLETYQKGEYVFLSGDPSTTVYSLLYGSVQLNHQTAQGRQFTLTIIKEGEIFGETSLAGEEKRRWTAQAVENSTLCAIQKNDFLHFSRSNPKMTLGITKLLHQQIIGLENKLEELIFKNMEARLAHTLLWLAERFGECRGTSVAIRLKLTNQDLAHLIGAARETVSSIIAQWKRQGVLSKTGGKIHLHHKETLKSIDS